MPEYIVQYGDTLSGISKKFYRSESYWQEIARLNHLSNPNKLFVGQKLTLPNSMPNQGRVLGNVRIATMQQVPAHLALARGFLFIIVDVLPEVGSTYLIRKVALIPKDFSLTPKNPFGSTSLIDHVRGLNAADSPFLSLSSKSYGAPSMYGIGFEKAYPLLVDMEKIKKAGGQIFSTSEIIAELRKFVGANPNSRQQIEKLISTIQNIEGENVLKGSTPPYTAKPVSKAHGPYIEVGEDLFKKYEAGKISRQVLESELAKLDKAYSKARIVGQVGRVFQVTGLVLTAVDLTRASQQSIKQQSFKPITAETIRQVGGWGGALAGAKIAGSVGALVSIETGPGAIVIGGVCAIVGGVAGYYGADWIADYIHKN